MRKEPMPPPLIRVMSKEEFKKHLDIQPHLKESIALHGRRGVNKDEICFINMGNYTEYACLAVLLHEIDHWAQEMYLTNKENNLRSVQYREKAKEEEVPFTEYAVAFSGGYDYEAWQKKYGNKNTPTKINLSRYYGLTEY